MWSSRFASRFVTEEPNCALGPGGEVGPAAVQTCGPSVVGGLAIEGSSSCEDLGVVGVQRNCCEVQVAVLIRVNSCCRQCD